MNDSKNSTSGLMVRNNTLYDIMKYLTQIVLPAIGTLYFAISQIWGLSHGTEVVGTIMAVDAFLGVLLGISSSAYHNSDAKYDGSIDIIETDTSKRMVLNVNEEDDLYELDQKKELVLKVNPVQE